MTYVYNGTSVYKDDIQVPIESLCRELNKCPCTLHFFVTRADCKVIYKFNKVYPNIAAAKAVAEGIVMSLRDQHNTHDVEYMLGTVPK